ncbi:polysaccharide biosynthesis/export family protein [Telmatobacter sp. DSM 110680]|uniref:Polysaccharide biosynthesis/export family protein n=1 Tax=Telmatobacter sp. DSM 110680 TaxID=3036704 RepID=A0AAU7DDX3_9BACT
MKCSALQAVVLSLGLAAASSVSGQTQSAGQPIGDRTPSAQPDANKTAHDDSFVIGNDDVLAISVWKEPELTKSIPVRSDGKISLPLVGEMMAAGQTPLQLEREITEKLKNFITSPEVTVIVEKVYSRKYNILGEVTKPGSYLLTADTTIMDAIAAAGGFRDFAKKTGVYVLRKSTDGHETNLKFNYKEFLKGKNSAQNVKLQPNDTIIVP